MSAELFIPRMVRADEVTFEDLVSLGPVSGFMVVISVEHSREADGGSAMTMIATSTGGHVFPSSRIMAILRPAVPHKGYLWEQDYDDRRGGHYRSSEEFFRSEEEAQRWADKHNAPLISKLDSDRLADHAFRQRQFEQRQLAPWSEAYDWWTMGLGPNPGERPVFDYTKPAPSTVDDLSEERYEITPIDFEEMP